MLPAGRARETSHEAEEFVRFCYHRRRVGWPELYDEMWAVASRGLFRGMGTTDLADVGIGFTLFQTPHLATLVTRIVTEEQAARRRAMAVAAEARAADEARAAERVCAAEEQAMGDEARLAIAAQVEADVPAPGVPAPAVEVARREAEEREARPMTRLVPVMATG
jgi:hypothetical protein